MPAFSGGVQPYEPSINNQLESFEILQFQKKNKSLKSSVKPEFKNFFTSPLIPAVESDRVIMISRSVDALVRSIHADSSLKEPHKNGWGELKVRWKKWRGDYFSTVFRSQNVQAMFTKAAKRHLEPMLKNPTLEDQDLLINLERELNAYVVTNLIDKKSSQNRIRKLVISKYLHTLGLTFSFDRDDPIRLIIKVRKDRLVDVEILPEEGGPQKSAIMPYDKRFSFWQQERYGNSKVELSDEQKKILKQDQILMGIREALESYPEEVVAKFVFGDSNADLDLKEDLIKWNVILTQLRPEESAILLSNLQNETGELDYERLKKLVSGVVNQSDNFMTLSRLVSILSHFPLSVEKRKSLGRITLDGFIFELLSDAETEIIGLKLLQRSHYVATRSEKSMSFYKAFELIEKPEDWYDDLGEILRKQKLRFGDLSHEIGFPEESLEKKILFHLDIIKQCVNLDVKNEAYTAEIVYQINSLKRLLKNSKSISVELREYIIFEIFKLLDENQDLPRQEKKKLVVLLKPFEKLVYGKTKTILLEALNRYEDPSFWQARGVEIYKNDPKKLIVYLNSTDHKVARKALEYLIEAKTDLWGCDLSRFQLKDYDFTGIQINNETAHQIIDNGGKISGANIWMANFSGETLENVDFSGCELSNARFLGSTIIGCSFTNVNLNSASFDECLGKDVVFNNIFLKDASFKKSHWEQSSFQKVEANEADFSDTFFSKGTLFLESDLTGASFKKSQLMGVSFNLVKFYDKERAHISPIKIVNFRDADLSGARFIATNVQYVNFSETNLSDANFRTDDVKSRKTKKEDGTVYLWKDYAGVGYKSNFSSIIMAFNGSESREKIKGIKLDLNFIHALPKDQQHIDLSLIDFSNPENILLKNLLAEKNIAELIPDLEDSNFLNQFRYCFDLVNGNLENFSFESTNLSNLSFLSVTFKNSRLRNTNLSNAFFDGSEFHSDFENVNLKDAVFALSTFSGDYTKQDFSAARLINCDFRKATLSVDNLRQILSSVTQIKNNTVKLSAEQIQLCIANDIPLTQICFEDLRFESVDFSRVEFTNCTFLYTHFDNCLFKNTNIYWEVTKIRNVLFNGCDFGNSFIHFNFHAPNSAICKFLNCDFTDATVESVYFKNKNIPFYQGIYIEFGNCDFKRANFDQFHFNIGKFSECDFREIKLDWKYQKYVDKGKYHVGDFIRGDWNRWNKKILSDYLSFVRKRKRNRESLIDLSETDLSGLDLYEFDLSSCDLQNVDFRDANLDKVNFKNSNISSSKFSLDSLPAKIDLRFAKVKNEFLEKLSGFYPVISRDHVLELSDSHLLTGYHLEGEYKYLEISDIRLRNLILKDVEFFNSKFENVEFSNNEISGCFRFRKSKFIGNYIGVQMWQAEFFECDFRNAKLSANDLRWLQENSKNSKINVDQVKLCLEENIPLTGFDLSGLKFVEMDFSNIDFTKVRLSATVFEKCNFKGVTIPIQRGMPKIRKCDLSLANLDLRVLFKYIQNNRISRDQLIIYLKYVRLYNLMPENLKNCRRKIVSELDLSGLDLNGVDFSGLNLLFVNFFEANLEGADFSSAEIMEVNFENAILVDAKFEKTSIINSNLKRTDRKDTILFDLQEEELENYSNIFTQ